MASKRLARPLLAVLVLGLLGWTITFASPAGAQAKPNVVVIMSDDLDVKTLGNLPRTRAEILDRGMDFRGAFAVSPVCCPNRASFLMGQYQHNHRTTRNSPGWQLHYAAGNEARDLGVSMQAAGYRTAYVGKYLNNYDPNDIDGTYGRAVPEGWNRWRVFVQDDEACSAGAAHLCYPDYYDYTLCFGKNDANGTRSRCRNLARYGTAEADYSTDVLAAKADVLIRSAHAADVPLFLVFAPWAPHQDSQCTPGEPDCDRPGATPAPRHRAALPGLTRPEQANPPAINENTSDKQAFARTLPTTDRAAIDRLHRRRAQSMLAVDEAVGRLVATLRELGELDNTYLIFTSDNGLQLGENRVFNEKQTPFRMSTRIPLWISGPGIAQGASTRAAVGMHDLAPTIADLAGAQLRTTPDGRSLRPLFAGGDPPWRNGLLIELRNQNAPNRAFDSIATTGLGAEAYDYVRYLDGSREFYQGTYTHNTRDAYEPLASGHPDVQARLERGLAALLTCAGAGCRIAEDSPDLAPPPAISPGSANP